MTNLDLSAITSQIIQSPLMGLTVTLVAYIVAYKIYKYTNYNALINPVLISISMVLVFLLITGISYENYFIGGQLIHFLLAPATIALAIPLYQHFAKIKKIWLAVLIAVISGVLISVVSAVTIAKLLNLSLQTQLSLAPKSVTTPVAISIAKQINAIPSLTAILVIATGIIGSILGTKIFAIMRIKNDYAKGIAMGVTAHGIGTARALQVSAEMGAFSSLAMVLSAITMAFVLPWLIGWVV